MTKRTNKRTETHACDCISRQAAIDAIRASTSKYTGFMEMEMYTDDDAVEAIKALPSAQPEQSVAQERYEDLCEYFGNDHDVIKTVLGDRKEFKAWLERLKWHIKECNKLSKQLEAQPEIIHCRDCKHWEKETTDKGYCKDLYGFGRWWKLDDHCSYAERRKE